MNIFSVVLQKRKYLGWEAEIEPFPQVHLEQEKKETSEVCSFQHLEGIYVSVQMTQLVMPFKHVNEILEEL